MRTSYYTGSFVRLFPYPLIKCAFPICPKSSFPREKENTNVLNTPSNWLSPLGLHAAHPTRAPRQVTGCPRAGSALEAITLVFGGGGGGGGGVEP